MYNYFANLFGYWIKNIIIFYKYIVSSPVSKSIHSQKQIKSQIYEKKFLNDIKKMKNTYLFTNEELQTIDKNYNKLCNDNFNECKNKINLIKLDITKCVTRILQLIQVDIFINDEINKNNTYNQDYNNLSLKSQNKQHIFLIKTINNIIEQQQYNDMPNIENIKKCLLDEKELLIKLKQTISTIWEKTYIPQYKLKENAAEHIIKLKHQTLLNSFVMEYTPNGNVLMKYNYNHKIFEYYSDKTIPNTMLEVVARKYVKTFNCRPIFYIMDEELNKYKQRQEHKEKQTQILKETQLTNITTNNTTNTSKKSVFATFKKYNNGNNTINSNNANNISNMVKQKIKNNELNSKKYILKENSNNYSFEGKISYFTPLQQKYKNVNNTKISYSDYKKNIV